MAGSTQEKLDRVRKPRVHIKYEVETEGATVEKELPFVVGVMGDFSGDPTQKLPEVRPDRSRQLQQDHVEHDARSEPAGSEQAGG